MSSHDGLRAAISFGPRAVIWIAVLSQAISALSFFGAVYGFGSLPLGEWSRLDWEHLLASVLAVVAFSWAEVLVVERAARSAEHRVGFWILGGIMSSVTIALRAIEQAVVTSKQSVGFLLGGWAGHLGVGTAVGVAVVIACWSMAVRHAVEGGEAARIWTRVETLGEAATTLVRRSQPAVDMADAALDWAVRRIEGLSVDLRLAEERAVGLRVDLRTEDERRALVEADLRSTQDDLRSAQDDLAAAIDQHAVALEAAGNGHRVDDTQGGKLVTVQVAGRELWFAVCRCGHALAVVDRRAKAYGSLQTHRARRHKHKGAPDGG